MQCPSCGTTFSEGAAYCPSCGWKVVGDPIDLAAANLLKVSKDVLHGSFEVAKKTAKAFEPAIDATARKIEETTTPIIEKAKPAMKKAAAATVKAVDEGVRVGKKAVHKTTEVAKKAAGKVRKKKR